MDKKQVMARVLLWTCFQGYGPQNKGRLSEEFSTMKRTRTIHIEPAVLEMPGFPEEIDGVIKTYGNGR